MTLLAAFPAAAFCLGSWQVYRLQWKLDLIKQTEAALARDPVPLAVRAADADLPSDHTKVRLDGQFDLAAEFLVGPRVREGQPGFHAVAPFELATGERVLVNRGWVARSAAGTSRDRFDAAVPENQGPVVGLLKRAGERPSWAHENEPASNTWYWLDVSTMAKLARTEPLLVEQCDKLSDPTATARAERGLPIPKEPTANLRNNHLEYAVTWYMLSAATTAMLVMRRRSAAARQAAQSGFAGVKGRRL
ncbi:surf-like protein [Blastocladiella emersonii ATCC 22665]|nr:surf-like protein [Blastocladiella emersonii ATCC 22665]